MRQILGSDLTDAKDSSEVVAALGETEVLVIPQYLYSGEVEAAVADKPTKLRWIQLLTAGFERIVKAKIAPEVVITTAGDGLSGAVADHAMALLLSLYRTIPESIRLQRAEQWDPSIESRMISLYDKTVAIIGYGSIGREIGVRARAFGAHIIGVASKARQTADGIQIYGPEAIDDVASRADVVFLSLPINVMTDQLFDARRLARLKRDCVVVNVGRGRVMDTFALAECLERGAIRGAGIDVTDPEPLPSGHPLWRASNVIITPHIGAGAGHDRLGKFVCENLKRYWAGEPLDSVLDRKAHYASLSSRE